MPYFCIHLLSLLFVCEKKRIDYAAGLLACRISTPQHSREKYFLRNQPVQYVVLCICAGFIQQSVLMQLHECSVRQPLWSHRVACSDQNSGKCFTGASCAGGVKCETVIFESEISSTITCSMPSFSFVYCLLTMIAMSGINDHKTKHKAATCSPFKFQTLHLP